MNGTATGWASFQTKTMVEGLEGGSYAIGCDNASGWDWGLQLRVQPADGSTVINTVPSKPAGVITLPAGRTQLIELFCANGKTVDTDLTPYMYRL